MKSVETIPQWIFREELMQKTRLEEQLRERQEKRAEDTFGAPFNQLNETQKVQVERQSIRDLEERIKW